MFSSYMYIIKGCCWCLFAVLYNNCPDLNLFPVHYQPCMHVSLMEMDGFLCRQHHTNVALACWIIEAVIACLPVLLISWWQVHQNQRSWSIVSSISLAFILFLFPDFCCISFYETKKNWSTLRNVVKIVVCDNKLFLAHHKPYTISEHRCN